MGLNYTIEMGSELRVRAPGGSRSRLHFAAYWLVFGVTLGTFLQQLTPQFFHSPSKHHSTFLKNLIIKLVSHQRMFKATVARAQEPDPGCIAFTSRRANYIWSSLMLLCGRIHTVDSSYNYCWCVKTRGWNFSHFLVCMYVGMHAYMYECDLQHSIQEAKAR